jgi:TonB-linked SusC/RagA family outer membrane protein
MVKKKKSVLTSIFRLFTTRKKGYLFPVLFILYLSFSNGLLAQNREQTTITGKVVNEKSEALSGASVMVKNTNRSVTTNTNGEYTIAVSSKETQLIFSLVGYESVTADINGRNSINITMTPTKSDMDEVVVVGYGTQRRKDLTGSISTISEKQFAERPVASYDQALQGLVPGIDVVQSSTRPGDVTRIRIRGIGSISGDTEPLYVIDGFPTDGQNASAINPADISSVEVLKDASSTAIYGSRGANGVIIITTKSGKGSGVVNVSLKSGFQKVNKSDYYSVLNSDQYIEWYKEKAINDGTSVPQFVTDYESGKIKTNTNWQDVIYRTAPFLDYNLSASGRTEKTSFLISGGYLKQNDILLNAGFEKFTALAKFDYHPSRIITIGLNLAPTYTIQKKSAPEDDFSSLTGAAVLLPPIIPVYDSTGNPSDPDAYGILNNTMANPLTIANNYQLKQENFLMLSNAYLQIQIMKGLIAKTSIGANLSDYEYHLFQKNGMQGEALFPGTYLEQNGARNVSWLSENTLNYRSTIANNHNLEILAGYTAQKTTYSLIGGSASGFSSNLAQTIAFGSTQQAYSGATGNSLLSYLARANYSYKDKYLLTATIRRDGSSRFGEDTKWGTFPSVAIGWNLSNEEFIRNGAKFIDYAKIRASYGRTGSNFIGDFTSKASLQAINYSYGNTPVVGFINADPGNPNLSWEKSDQLDLGLDMNMIKRINFTFDYFHYQTKDLLLAVNVPPSVGFGSYVSNIGSMKKWGFEASLNLNIIKQKNWEWNVGGNITHLRQEVTSLGPTGAPIYSFFNVLMTAIGGPLEQEMALKQIGILSQKDLDNGVAHKPGDQAGDYKFLDVNGDGLIDAFNGADGVPVGDNNPRWLYGINSNVRYKHLTLSVLFQGQQGAKLLDFVYQIMSLHNNNTNMGTYFWYGRYISESEPGNGWVPRAGYNDVGAVSSWEVQKTDFFRIRNISLTYQFPEDISRKLLTNDLRAYITVENLHTYKQFQGGNPEATRFGSSRIVSDGRTLGLNSVATPPLPMMFTLGINFSF